jgi:hypothetical protein
MPASFPKVPATLDGATIMIANSENRSNAAEVLSNPIQPQVVYVQSAPRQPVMWIIALLLAVIATATIVRWDESSLFKSAFAQSAAPPRAGLEGARGIYAFTGQLNARSYGLFMLDADTGTVWCYEIQGTGAKGEPRLTLVAARSWVYDRYLEEFNTGEPIPSQVREMVQQERIRRTPTTRPSAGVQ